MTDPTNTESHILFARCERSDNEAQSLLHDRYANRLLGLVQSRLRREFQARFDAEDVVNSAFRSFFIGLQKGRFVLPAQGGLWPLLAQITLHKLHRANQHHARIRRAANAEQQLTADVETGNSNQLHTELSLRDELTWLSQRLPDGALSALELSMQGFEQIEIADRLGCTTRTVRRYLAETRTLLRARLSQFSDADRKDSPIESSGELSADEYLLRRMIGAGVFGKVYLATEKATGADVAVKYLRKRWAQDPIVVRRFEKETTLLQQLNIDGVVPCYGGGRASQGGRFYVMKWIDGRTLSDRTDIYTPSEATVRNDFAALALTLSKVHAASITHCDLKPTNILIDNDEQWWLTDFGFARQSLTSVTDLAGTPAYMAPEQLDPFFGPIGPWTDLYAVGKMMLEMLTGKNPPKVPADRPPTADQLLTVAESTVSSGMKRVLRQLLRRGATDRLSSAEQLAQLLGSSE